MFRAFRDFFITFDAINRNKASEMLDWELNELQNTFSLLVLGSFAGIPAPPVYITLQLIPLMEDEMLIMNEKILTARDPLGEMFSLLEIA